MTSILDMEYSKNTISKLTYVKFHLSKNLTQDILDKIYSEIKCYLKQNYFKKKTHMIFKEIMSNKDHVIKITHLNDIYLIETHIYRDNKYDVIRFEDTTYHKKKRMYLI